LLTAFRYGGEVFAEADASVTGRPCRPAHRRRHRPEVNGLEEPSAGHQRRSFERDACRRPLNCACGPREMKRDARDGFRGVASVPGPIGELPIFRVRRVEVPGVSSIAAGAPSAPVMGDG